tara:strand:- start:10027 stop:10827 length:801 start_codon:yes stop_codon:yes gene_type:complete
MKNKARKALYIVAIAAAAGAAIGFTAPLIQGEETVKLAELPKAVRHTIDQHAKGGKIEQIERETEDGIVVYSVEVEGKGGDFEFEVGEDGTFMGMDTEDEGDGESDNYEQVFEIPFSEAPRAVQDAFNTKTNHEKPTRVERIVDESITKYEIEHNHLGATASITLTDLGEIIEIETPVRSNQIPGAVLKEIMKDYPGAKIQDAEHVQLFYYEMDVLVDGKIIEVAAFATGDLEDYLLGDQSDENGHADHDGDDHDDHEDSDEEDDD